jgi:hypothetical protein
VDQVESSASPQQDGQESSRGPRQGGDRPSGGRGGGRPPAGRPPEEGRRRKSPGRYTGFNDGIERVWCSARVHHPAPAFPVHSRAAATRPVVVVDQREGEILLCDGEHWGDHRWPHLALEERPEERPAEDTVT